MVQLSLGVGCCSFGVWDSSNSNAVWPSTTSTKDRFYVFDNDSAIFSINGNLEVGQTLEIVEDTADSQGTGTLSYKWQSQESADNSWIDATDLGQSSYIRFQQVMKGKQ